MPVAFEYRSCHSTSLSKNERCLKKAYEYWTYRGSSPVTTGVLVVPNMSTSTAVRARSAYISPGLLITEHEALLTHQLYAFYSGRRCGFGKLQDAALAELCPF